MQKNYWTVTGLISNRTGKEVRFYRWPPSYPVNLTRAVFSDNGKTVFEGSKGSLYLSGRSIRSRYDDMRIRPGYNGKDLAKALARMGLIAQKALDDYSRLCDRHHALRDRLKKAAELEDAAEEMNVPLSKLQMNRIAAVRTEAQALGVTQGRD